MADINMARKEFQSLLNLLRMTETDFDPCVPLAEDNLYTYRGRKVVCEFDLLKEKLVEMMDEAEKATNLLLQQLFKREAVNEILHKYKQLFFQGNFQTECLAYLGVMDRLSKRSVMDILSKRISRDVQRDKYNYCLERWKTLKKTMGLTTVLLLNHLPEAWKEYAYVAFPTIDDASAYLYSSRNTIVEKTSDVFSVCKYEFRQGEVSSLFLALERAIQEYKNVESQLDYTKKKLNESNQENICLAKEIKELRGKHAQVIDEQNIMKRDKETCTSNAMVDSQTQVSSLNEVSPENATDKTILKSVEVETMTEYSREAEDTTVKEPDSDPTTTHCSATEETLVKEVDYHSTSHLQDGPTNDHSEQTICLTMGSGTKNTTLKEENVGPADENTTDETGETVIDSEFVIMPSEIETEDATVYTCQRSEPVYGLDSFAGTQNTESVLSIDDSSLFGQGSENLETVNEATKEENIPTNPLLPNNKDDQCSDTARQRRQPNITNSLSGGLTDADDTDRQARSEQNGASRKSVLVTSSQSNEMVTFLLSNFFEIQKRACAIEPHELLRRTFGVPTLIVKIEAKVPYDDDTAEFVFQPNPVLVRNDDEDCISRYMGTQGFHLLCREENTLYFNVGNRGRRSVNSEIDRIQSELRVLCFGRFHGRVIGDRRIDSPEDLLISYLYPPRGARPIDQSTWRFYFILVENRKTVIRQTDQMTCCKVSYAYMYMYHLFAVLCLLMKIIKGF